MAHKIQRRALLYLEERYQSAVLRRVALQWCALVGVSLAVLCVLAVFSNDDPRLSLSAVIQETLLRNLPLVVVLLALLPAFLRDSLKLSHQVVGPVQKLHCAMRSILEGEAPRPVQIRRRDYFQDVVSDYNQLIRRLPTAPEALIDDDAAREVDAFQAEQYATTDR